MPANPMTNLLDLPALLAMEDQARRLADTNSVEAAWFLRGVLDALEGAKPDPTAGNYRHYYLIGHDYVTEARARLGV